MMQNLIVALIVIVAAIYVLRKYLPAGLRARWVYALRKGGTAPSKLATWLDNSSSCASGCDTCKACETPADPAPREHVIKIVRR